MSSTDTQHLTVALGARLGASFTVYVYDALDSTNSEAKRLAAAGVERAVIVADRQTAGRGRMGRSFFSPAGTGAYFSFLYTPKAPLADAVSVTSAVAVAVMETIYKLTGQRTLIKWVNDLYLDGKKICGILCESVTVDDRLGIIVGIGINLSTSDFPAELAERAGSLQCEIDRAELIAEIWKRLSESLEHPETREWLESYRTHSCVIGRAITWTRDGATHTGVAEGIDENGGLCVRGDDGGLEILRTGEITVRIR